MRGSPTALVTAYGPAWPARYAAEAARLAPVLHHIGSTAVPGFETKPTIDILGFRANAAVRNAMSPALVALGYDAQGENGIDGRLLLRLTDGWKHGRRYRASRARLRAHPAMAADYGAHERALAARPGRSRVGLVADDIAFLRAAYAEPLARRDARHDNQRLRRR